jgi:hypothetical protein
MWGHCLDNLTSAYLFTIRAHDDTIIDNEPTFVLVPRRICSAYGCRMLKAPMCFMVGLLQHFGDEVVSQLAHQLCATLGTAVTCCGEAILDSGQTTTFIWGYCSNSGRSTTSS